MVLRGLYCRFEQREANSLHAVIQTVRLKFCFILSNFRKTSHTRLEFSNSEAGGNFEIMRVRMGKRNFIQSCVLYEVTQEKDNSEIMRVCMEKRNTRGCVIINFKPIHLKLCLIWSNSRERQL